MTEVELRARAEQLRSLQEELENGEAESDMREQIIRESGAALAAQRQALTRGHRGTARSSIQGIARCCVGDIGLAPGDAVESDRATAGGEDGGARGDEPGRNPLTDPARCAGADRGEPSESARPVTSPNAIDSQS
mgnify:CR=1 FL=1